MTIFSQQAIEAANSLLGALYLSETGRLEKTELIEGHLTASLFQAIQGRQALYFVNQLFSQVGRAPLENAWKWGVQLVPSLMTLLSWKLPEGRIQKTAESLYHQTGTFFRVTSFVSQVALVYFTGSTAALVSVVYLTIDRLDESHCLHPLLSKVYRSAFIPLFLVGQFFSAGNLAAAYAWGTSTIIWTATEYLVPLFANKAHEIINRPPPKQSLSPQIFQAILSSKEHNDLLQPQLSYLNEEALPVRPVINPEQTLLRQWKQIPWNEHKELLQGCSVDDLEKVLANRLANFKKGRSEINTYQLRVIAKRLSDKPEKERAKFLAELATAEKPLEAVLNEFNRCMAPAQQDPAFLRTLILQELQITRTTDFFYQESQSHYLQKARTFFATARTLGLSAGLSQLLGLIHWNSYYQLHPLALSLIEEDRKKFLKAINCYFPTDLAIIAKNVSNFNQAATTWWKSFIQQQSPNNQKQFLQSLATTQGKGNLSLAELEAISELRITDSLVLAMLFEMGIVELTPPKA